MLGLTIAGALIIVAMSFVLAKLAKKKLTQMMLKEKEKLLNKNPEKYEGSGGQEDAEYQNTI
jgi:hypothetical protein